MTEGFSSILLSKTFRRILAIVLLMIGGFASWKMYITPLWGWWPLVMILAFWLSGMLLLFPKDRHKIKWLGLSTLSGVLLGLGFPPSPLTWVVFLAWVPLLWMENEMFKKENKTQPGQVFLYAFNAFVFWNVIATFWVMNTAFFAGIVANFLNAAIMAGVVVLIHVIGRRLVPGQAGLLFVSLWISFEYLHHFWDISWPWLTHGNALCEYPWAVQWYEYLGAFGGSLWVLLVNLAGFAVFLHGKQWRLKGFALFGGLVIVPVLISLWIGSQIVESANRPVQIAIVQPNYEPHYEKFTVPERVQSRRFAELSLSVLDDSTEYLVFPETSFDRIRLNTFRENPAINMCQSLVDSFPNLRLITGLATFRVLEEGALEDANYRIHVNTNGDSTYWDIQNAAVQLTSGESAYDVYFKSKLVPGPEMFPFRNILFFLKPLIDQLGGTYEGHTKQKTRDVFSGGSLDVAPVICYESIYGDYAGGYIRNGATVMFIVTNDGWWDNTPGHIQHLKLGTLRAIEHRRPIARSANTGISCFIDIKGRIHQPTAYGEAIAIKGKLIPETRITFYTKWGDLVARGSVLIWLLLLIYGFGARIARGLQNSP